MFYIRFWIERKGYIFHLKNNIYKNLNNLQLKNLYFSLAFPFYTLYTYSITLNLHNIARIKYKNIYNTLIHNFLFCFVERPIKEFIRRQQNYIIINRSNTIRIDKTSETYKCFWPNLMDIYFLPGEKYIKLKSIP